MSLLCENTDKLIVPKSNVHGPCFAGLTPLTADRPNTLVADVLEIFVVFHVMAAYSLYGVMRAHIETVPFRFATGPSVHLRG